MSTPQQESDAPEGYRHAEYRDSRRSHEIAELWNNSAWLLRRQLVHDFSNAADGEYKQKSTFDIDFSEVCSALRTRGRRQVAIPLEWRPKGLVMSLDASYNNSSCHIVSRSSAQLALNVPEYVAPLEP